MALDLVTSPSFTGTRRVMDAFSQGVATGRIPSRRYLDRLIQAELDAAENNAIKQRAFNEQVRQFNVNQENVKTAQENAADTASANRTSGVVGSITNLGSSAAMAYLLKPKTPITPTTLNPVGTATGLPTYSTPVNPTDLGMNIGKGTGEITNNVTRISYPNPSATQLPVQELAPPSTPMSAIEYQPSVSNPGMDLNVPMNQPVSATNMPPAVLEGYPVDTSPVVNVAGESPLSATAPGNELASQAAARQAMIEAEQAGGTGLASADGISAGMGGAGEAGASAAGGGPTIAGGATVLAYIAAADMVRQAWGQLDKPYGERDAFAKFASAPVMGGVPALMEVAGMGDSNYFAKGPNRLARIEEKLVGEPLDKAFAGDIGGSLEAFAKAGMDVPRDAWNMSVGAVIPGAETWLCTEIWKRGGIDEVDNLVLQRLRRFAIKNHRAWIREYLDKGKILVEKIANAISDEAVRDEFYHALKTNMVGPVVELTKDGKNEEAFQIYKDYTWKLFDKYAPGVLSIDPAEV